MAILIHVPKNEKSVGIVGYDDPSELLVHPNPAIRQIWVSCMTIIRNFCYSELIYKGEFTQEEIEEHIRDFDDYLVISDEAELDGEMDAAEERQSAIEDRIQELMTSDEFIGRHELLRHIITRELFRTFASGAVALEEGELIIKQVPSELKHLFGAQA